MKIINNKIKSRNNKSSKFKTIVKRSTLPAKMLPSKSKSEPESEASSSARVNKISNEEFAKIIFKFPLFFASDLTFKQQQLKKKCRDDFLSAVHRSFGQEFKMPQIVRKIQNMRALVTKESDSSNKKPAWDAYQRKLFDLRFQNSNDPMAVAKQSKLVLGVLVFCMYIHIFSLFSSRNFWQQGCQAQRWFE